jgi:hypothetical protein
MNAQMNLPAVNNILKSITPPHRYRSRRNMTLISDISGTYIRHRFMGHVDLQGNYLGMQTFTDAAFVQNELYCLLGLVGNDLVCPLPDIIILNSGHHDVKDSLEVFDKNLRKFLEMMRTEYRYEFDMQMAVFTVECGYYNDLFNSLKENTAY